jgi:hypothetical protein
MNRLTVASLPAAAFGVAFLFSAGTPPAQPIPSGPVLHAAAPLPAMAVAATTPKPAAHEPRAAKRPAVRRRVAKRQPAKRPARQAPAPVVTPVATATATATVAPPPPPATPKPKPKPAATPASNFDSSGGFDSQG